MDEPERKIPQGMICQPTGILDAQSKNITSFSRAGVPV